MEKHSHNFVDTYDGLVAFGMDRTTDENTITYCLQKFSDDRVMELMRERLTDAEMEEIFNLITRLLKTHLSEEEYHECYLKDGGKDGDLPSP